MVYWSPWFTGSSESIVYWNLPWRAENLSRWIPSDANWCLLIYSSPALNAEASASALRHSHSEYLTLSVAFALLPAAAMEKATVPIHALCMFMPLDTKIRRSVRKSRLSQIHTITRSAAVKAAGGHQLGPDGPSIVDTELIVLRKRMHEVRRQERNYSPPQHWMKWEKEWSVTYASDVCEAVGWLQNKLINTRPSVAIASLAFMSLSVPASVFLLLSQVSAALSELSLMIHTKF